jgi:hypothetical protein
MNSPRVDTTPFGLLYEHAVPSKGAYRDHIGHVRYTTLDGEVYTTLIMTKTDSDFKVNGKSYPMIAGYLQV